MNLFNVKSNSKKGFTLIELLVVIAIIGLLATISIIALNSARMKARDTRRLADIKAITTALDLYFDDHNYYPPNTEKEVNGCDSSTTGSFIPELIFEGYLKNKIIDPINIYNASRYSFYIYCNGNYSTVPCPGDPEAVIRFYLENKSDPNGFIYKGLYGGGYSYNKCIY